MIGWLNEWAGHSWAGDGEGQALIIGVPAGISNVLSGIVRVKEGASRRAGEQRASSLDAPQHQNAGGLSPEARLVLHIRNTLLQLSARIFLLNLVPAK